MKTVEYAGFRFTKDNKTGYYLSTSLIDGKRERLHRFVWESVHGKIPSGAHIHHVDEDKDNNDISNLELLSAHSHEKLHMTERKTKYPDMVARFSAAGAKVAPKWHKSDAGHEWHKKHYERMKNLFYKKSTLVCEQCGREYETVDQNHNRFCSNRCKSQWRRDHHLDDELRVCVICGKEFLANKYSKRKTCSDRCKRKSTLKTRWGKS